MTAELHPFVAENTSIISCGSCTGLTPAAIEIQAAVLWGPGYFTAQN